MAATLSLALDIATLERVVLRPGPEFSDNDFLEFCREHDICASSERQTET